MKVMFANTAHYVGVISARDPPFERIVCDKLQAIVHRS